jgi:hypothetical protein
MAVIDGDFCQTNKFLSSRLTPWYTKNFNASYFFLVVYTKISLHESVYSHRLR